MVSIPARVTTVKSENLSFSRARAQTERQTHRSVSWTFWDQTNELLTYFSISHLCRVRLESYGGLELPTTSEFGSSVAAADLSWDHSGEQGLVQGLVGSNTEDTREEMNEGNRNGLGEQVSGGPYYEDVQLDVELDTADDPIYDLVVEEGEDAGGIELSEYARSGSQAGDGEGKEVAETAV